MNTDGHGSEKRNRVHLRVESVRISNSHDSDTFAPGAPPSRPQQVRSGGVVDLSCVSSIFPRAAAWKAARQNRFIIVMA